MRTYLRIRFRDFRRLMFVIKVTPIYSLCLGFISGLILTQIGSGLVILIGLFALCIKLSSRVLLIGVAIGAIHSGIHLSTERVIDELVGTFFSGEVEIVELEQLSPATYKAIGKTNLVTKIGFEVSSTIPLGVGCKLELRHGLLDYPKSSDGFNYKEYLASKGVRLIISNQDFIVSRIDENSCNKALQLVENAVSTATKEPVSSFLKGITIGRGELSYAVQEEIRRTGLSHITSVSGYNVSIILGLIISISGRLPRMMLAALSPLLLLLYMYLVGWDNLPAQRAALMGMIVITSWFIGRKGSIYSGMLLAVVIMLVLNPEVWRNISFQLSVSAMLGVLIATPRIERYLSILPGWLKQNISPTLGATLATLPITISSFGTTSLVAVPANMLVLPFIPVAMLLGSVGITLMVIGLDLLAQPLMFTTEIILNFSLEIISRLASVPWAESNDPRVGLVMITSILVPVVTSDIWITVKRAQIHV